jgi:hypothetical protein
MRSILLFAPALLAACATVPAAVSDPPVHGETPGRACTTAGTAQFIGQTRSDYLRAAIMRVSKAAVLRWAPPGVMLTMDYRTDRVTVRLDPSNRVTQIKCG